MQDDAGLVLRLELTAFDIEYEDSSNYNSLTISEISQNGRTTILIEKCCGDTLPPVIFSNTNKVNLYFETDLNVTKKGWFVKWTAMCNDRAECGEALVAGRLA